MKKLHKKIISAFLPVPLFLVITFCCCLDEKSFADEAHSDFSTERYHKSHDLETSDHSEHQDHSEGDHECTCPKHLSFLSGQSVDIILDSPVSQMLAKHFMANLQMESIVFLVSLSNHSQGPPVSDRIDHVSIP